VLISEEGLCQFTDELGFGVCSFCFFAFLLFWFLLFGEAVAVFFELADPRGVQSTWDGIDGRGPRQQQ
jgi:hypothetical protein